MHIKGDLSILLSGICFSSSVRQRNSSIVEKKLSVTRDIGSLLKFLSWIFLLTRTLPPRSACSHSFISGHPLSH
jgi:hypothetical protein